MKSKLMAIGLAIAMVSIFLVSRVKEVEGKKGHRKPPKPPGSGGSSTYRYKSGSSSKAFPATKKIAIVAGALTSSKLIKKVYLTNLLSVL